MQRPRGGGRAARGRDKRPEFWYSLVTGGRGGRGHRSRRAGAGAAREGSDVEIKRTGPPSARDVRGKQITWTLPLNSMPPKEWTQFFKQTTDATVVCSPHKVSIYQGQMVFESVEDDVPIWIKFIDTWMATANGRYKEWDTGERRRRGENVDVVDREKKLVDLNEKFKNL